MYGLHFLFIYTQLVTDSLHPATHGAVFKGRVCSKHLPSSYSTRSLLRANPPASATVSQSVGHRTPTD